MADDNADAFRRSTFSGGNNCVEVAVGPAGPVSVRSSRTPGDVMTFTPDGWDAFVAGVKDGRFDRPGS